MSTVLCFRSLRVLRLLVVLSLLTVSLSSFAGYYSVSYSSGGTAVHRGTTYSYSQAYSQFGGGSSPYSPDVTASFGDEEDVYPEEVVDQVAECSGSITATFTWHPDNPSDLPPHTAILKEYGFARWDANIGIGFATVGFADDGLGHTATTDSQTYAQSTGVKYTVVTNPGQTWSLPTPRSPHVKGTSSWGYQWGPTARARLTYTSALYPIWIDTTNTVNADYLIYAEAGRKTNAYLTCNLPNSSFSNHNWSVSGSIFKQFDTTSPQGHVVNLSSTDLHSGSPTWIYKDGIGNSDISCAAHIATTDGLLSEDVTVTKTLSVEIVSISATNDFATISGYGWGNLYSNGNPYVTGEGTTDPVGMKVHVLASGTAPAPHFSPGGYLAGLQLALLYWTSGSVVVATTDSESMLDGSFPYQNSGRIYGTLSSFDDDDSPHAVGTSIQVNSTFDTYIMYKPDASAGADWIPLKKFLWTWTTDMYGYGTDGEPDGVAPFTIHSHPEWLHTFSR